MPPPVETDGLQAAPCGQVGVMLRGGEMWKRNFEGNKFQGGGSGREGYLSLYRRKEEEDACG